MFFTQCIYRRNVHIGSRKLGASSLPWRESASLHFSQAPVKLSSRSSTPSPTPLFSADAVIFKANSQSSAVTKTDSASTAVKEIAVCTKPDTGDMAKSHAVTAGAVEAAAANSHLTSAGLTFTAVAVEKRETASQTCSAPKRQIPESDDNAEDDEIATPLFVNKKQRIQHADLAQKEGKMSFSVIAVLQIMIFLSL